MDIVAKHRPGVAVFAADRRAGEGDKGGVGQRIAQVLGITHLVALDHTVHSVVRQSQLGPMRRVFTITSRYNIHS